MNDQPRPDNFEIPIPEPYLLAIGRVTVAWGILESAIDLSITKLVDLGTFDPRGSILTAHMTWPLKMDILESLAAARSKERPRLADFPATKPLLKKAQEGRNLAAHGHWIMIGGQVHRMRPTARGKLKASVAPVPLAEIEVVTADIYAAGRAVLKVVFDA